MSVGLSLPDLKEDCKAEKIEDGEEKVAANVVDPIILTDELCSPQNGDEGKELCVRLGKRPVKSNALPIVISNVL